MGLIRAHQIAAVDLPMPMRFVALSTPYHVLQCGPQYDRDCAEALLCLTAHLAQAAQQYRDLSKRNM
jgi:hypothetical protein